MVCGSLNSQGTGQNQDGKGKSGKGQDRDTEEHYFVLSVHPVFYLPVLLTVSR